MDSDGIRNYFDNLGFELVEIDGHEVLFLELAELGDYAVVTDMDGNIPDSLEVPVIWSVYDENDSFQWSVTIENATFIKRLFEDVDSKEDVLATLRDLREDNIIKSDEY